MLHPDWFPGGEEETTRQLVSSIAKNLSAELGQRESRALSYRLARELDLRGRPEDPKRERCHLDLFVPPTRYPGDAPRHPGQ